MEMEVQSGIHELDEVVEGKKLGAHAGLIAEEVTFLLIIRSVYAYMARVKGEQSACAVIPFGP